ncbi:MAG: head GIN domain-containing protein, partial [Polaribacter sp.]
MNKKIIVTSLILSIAFSINAQSWWGNSKKIKGNGKIVTINRTTADYDGVSIGGSFDVVLVKGKEGNITIQGEENIIPYLETKVSGNTLKIKYKKNTNIRTTKKLTITVTFMDIKSVALGGSGNISSKGLIKNESLKVSLGGSGNITLKVNTNTIKASIGGSGNIHLNGTAHNLKCSIAGSGSIRAFGLQTDEIKATIAGSGSIKTTVKTKIKANIVGSGNLYYKGNPTHIDS